MASAEQVVGRNLGRYLVIEQIGAGGMGVVYRARDQRLERDVALKILAPGTLADEAARRHFRKEALALSRLSHPNIAVIFDFDTEDGTDFLIMELIPGEGLDRRIASGPLPEKEVIRLGTQLAEGLRAAHEQGLLHCDLKPANLRVTPDGWLKILDFGLARLLRAGVPEAPTASLSDSMQAMGTLPYMAPEQLRAQKLDARTDLWAAGAVLYELATGRKPFRAPGLQVIDAILNEAPAPPSTLKQDLSAGLDTVTIKCLDKDPENRYQSAKELGVDLRRLGGQTTSGVLPPRPAARRGFTFRAGAILALLMLAVLAAGLFIAVPMMQKRVAGKARIRSLAVLPLTNLSRDPAQQYFSEGITEALITELMQIRELNVVSRTSSAQYAHSDKALPEIARELHVDALIEGSVQHEDGRVAINLNLVDASDHPVRAIRMERELRDLFAVEREVARTVATEVQVTLTAEEQQYLANARAVDPAAHEAYLMGLYLAHGSHEQRRRAKQYFEDAIARDPMYALAYAGLANYYWSMSGLAPAAAMPEAKRNARKALELDPHLAAAHTTLASVYFYADFDWNAAEEQFKHAIALYPNYAEGHRMYSVFLAAMGRAQSSIEEAQRSMALDPTPLARATLGWNLYYARRYEEAAQQCRGVLELEPGYANAYECMGASYTALGRLNEAAQACRRAVELSQGDPVRKVCLGRAYALAGKKVEARRILADLLALSQRVYVPAYYAATLYVALGQPDEALGWLDKAYGERDRYLAWLKVDETLDPLRSQPRFQSLLRRVGLPP